MSDDLYDVQPYHSRAFAFTHPDRLAAMGRIFGLPVAPVETSRILELGCAGGGNLWPIAEQLPEATVVGIDLSQVQIDQGREIVEQLGLRNLDLRQGDIAELSDDLGTFDYVIAHGVYSWVPPEVADALLDVIGRALSPNGVAVVSYNCYPGAYLRQMTRDMMRFHVQGIDDLGEAIGQARGMMDFLAAAAADDPYGEVLRAEQLAIAQTGDHVMLHGRLAPINNPYWFQEFVSHAMEHGLGYLADADIGTMLLDHHPPEIQEALSGLAGDLVQLEQYLDFATGRNFRRSVLCHGEAEVDRNLDSGRLAGLHISGGLWPIGEVGDLRTEEPVTFQAKAGGQIEVGEPIIKAALAILAEQRPATMQYEALVDAACERIGRKPKGPRVQSLADNLLVLWTHRVVDLVARPLPVAAEVPDRPTASPLARWQAELGGEVTTQLHEPQPLKNSDRALVALLDGSRDAAALASELEFEGGEEGVRKRLEGLRRVGLIAPAS